MVDDGQWQISGNWGLKKITSSAHIGSVLLVVQEWMSMRRSNATDRLYCAKGHRTRSRFVAYPKWLLAAVVDTDHRSTRYTRQRLELSAALGKCRPSVRSLWQLQSECSRWWRLRRADALPPRRKAARTGIRRTP